MPAAASRRAACGTIVALGAPSALLHEGTLGELYGVGVETVEAPDGRRAFLPG